MRTPRPSFSAYLNFAWGIDDTTSEVKADPRSLQVARNVTLERDGSVSSRGGALLLSTLGSGGECGLLYWWIPAGGSPELLGVFGASLLRATGNNFDTTLLSGLTPNLVMLVAPFRQRLYLNNGTDIPLVYWQGAPSTPRVYRPGQPAPTAPTANVATPTGSLTPGQKFRVRVRYVGIFSDSEFGEPSPYLDATVGTNGGTRINIPTFSGTAPTYRVAKRIIERTIAQATTSVEGPYYRDGIVNDNSTTIYDVTQSDALLTANEQMPELTSRLVPPKLFPFIHHNNRIVGCDQSDPGKIVWTEIDDFGLLPEAFPALNFDYLDIEDQRDAPIAMAPLNEYIMVYCGRSVHALHIDAAGNSFNQRISRHKVGIASARAVVETDFGHALWTLRGPYVFDGDFKFAGSRIKTLLKSIPKANLANMFAVHRVAEDRRLVKFVLPVNGTQNDTAFVLHYEREGAPTDERLRMPHAWTIYDGFTAKSALSEEHPSTREEIEISGDYAGKMYQEDTGVVDAHDPTAAINAVVETAWLDCRTPHMDKEFLRAWILVAGDTAALSCAWETDFGEGPVGSQSMTLGTLEGKFDEALFDEAQFGGGQLREFYVPLAENGVSARGKRIKLTFSGSPTVTTAGQSTQGGRSVLSTPVTEADILALSPPPVFWMKASNWNGLQNVGKADGDREHRIWDLATGAYYVHDAGSVSVRTPTLWMSTDANFLDGKPDSLPAGKPVIGYCGRDTNGGPTSEGSYFSPLNTVISLGEFTVYAVRNHKFRGATHTNIILGGPSRSAGTIPGDFMRIPGLDATVDDSSVSLRALALAGNGGTYNLHDATQFPDAAPWHRFTLRRSIVASVATISGWVQDAQQTGTPVTTGDLTKNFPFQWISCVDNGLALIDCSDLHEAELIVFPGAHDDATRLLVWQYLDTEYHDGVNYVGTQQPMSAAGSPFRICGVVIESQEFSPRTNPE